MYEYKAKVIHVVDGDTIDVICDLGFNITFEMRIRFASIDTPEIYHYKTKEEKERGIQAKQFVIDTLLNKEVTIKTKKDKKGKYGRYIANIYYDNKEICEELKLQGLEKRHE